MNPERGPDYRSITYPLGLTLLALASPLLLNGLGAHLTSEQKMLGEQVVQSVPVVVTALNLAYTIYQGIQVGAEKFDHYVPGRSLASRRIERIFKTAAGALLSGITSFSAFQQILPLL